MTKILANDTFGKQMIFNSFTECAKYLNIMQTKIKKSIDSGECVHTDKGSWFLDIFEE